MRTWLPLGIAVGFNKCVAASRRWVKEGSACSIVRFDIGDVLVTLEWIRSEPRRAVSDGGDSKRVLLLASI